MNRTDQAKKTPERCAGELLWAVSLLPVPSAARKSEVAQAVVFELPIAPSTAVPTAALPSRALRSAA